MNRFVAISLGALGDFLLALPLLRELRRRGTVAVVTRGAYRDLLPDWLAEAAFFPIDGMVGTRLFTPDGTLPNELAQTVAGAEPHVFARQDDTLSDNLQRHGAARIVWHDPRPQTPPHVVARFFAEVGLTPPVGWLDTPCMPVATAGTKLWIHAGSGSPAKNLPLPFLAGQAKRWRDETGQSVVVSFGEADINLREPLCQTFAQHGIDYEEIVCPSLAELRLRLGLEARRFIGADTGVTHLAAALGKEVLVGFRATDPAVWKPTGDCRVISREELEREPFA